ncbi:NUDIX hydrolase [Granulosicoccaceae sp. 1_MG-2023]|nr:NUDIX hydrolase [Granulosicoccaceae sp. 1_MG-2023]
MSDAIVPRPAASVIPLRERAGRTEILLVKRNAAIAFLGDTWVFPGGKIDPQDRAADEEQTARRAASRELAEETALQLSPPELLPFSHWTTPAGGSHRYATWFYIGLADHRAAVQVDGSEIVDACWDSADALLRRHAEGALRISAPAYVSLLMLRDISVKAGQIPALPEFARYRPRLAAVDGGHCALYQEDAGYESLQLDAVGPRHRLWMLNEGWRYERD